MKNKVRNFNRIAIKVGTNVITQSDGSLNVGRMLRIVEDISVLQKRGMDVILVSSGAVAAGKSEIVPSRKTNIVASKQILASIGQVKLMSTYQFLFGKYNIPAGQLLATKESFRDRRHYLNMKNCMTAMLENGVLPIVNENDTVSVNELMFTDNDELSGLISAMMDCDALFILSNVDGIYNASPSTPGAELISEIDPLSDDPSACISNVKSEFGRGGMLTKYSIARKIASEGIEVFIANGMRDNIITGIIGGRDVPFTHITASPERKNGVKKWLYHSDTFAKGAVYINDGAKDALLSGRATSLLLIGITRVEGYFKNGDIVRILDSNGNCIGIGKSQYDSDKAKLKAGEKNSKPFIHYDYMVLNDIVKENASY
ncbi:MAG: glutamate 5-kinase [Bacteroidales bacterium]|nr:glutamate 5-kinase [Bacteroidales bacterium]